MPAPMKEVAQHMNLFHDMQDILFIAEGVLVTLEYSVLSVFVGLILGAFLAFFKVSRYFLFNAIANFYTSVFRGTPLLIQLFFVFHVMPQLAGIKLSIFTSGVVALSLNSAAYTSEIIKAGIVCVPKGQFEAARLLGLNYRQTMLGIILPQAIKNILPALVNELINLTKETAIISVIGGMDIMSRAQIVAAEEYNYLKPMLVAALMYYILILALSFAMKLLENRLKS